MNRLIPHILPLFLALIWISHPGCPDASAQSTGTLPEIPSSTPEAVDTIYNPDVIYSAMPRTYEIAGINVKGADNVEDYVLIGFSGLSVGQKVTIPGPDITEATKRFWKQRLYSSVKIKVDKIAGDKAWLTIELRQQPRMSELRFEGVKGGEKKDLEKELGMVEGQQITPNILAQMKTLIERYYSKKGFKNAKVDITEIPDLSRENQVILQVNVNRSNKIKVHKIYINGNNVLSDS